MGRQRMSLSTKQRGVLRGMGGGMAATVALIGFGVLANPLGYPGDMPVQKSLAVALGAAGLPALFLAISIGRLAKHRFFSPQDIDGAGLSHGTARARELQALLQNTLEQVTLGAMAYALWASMMPSAWLSVVPLAALVFAAGRVLFFVGYAKGAEARALGFALTFYPSVGMLACAGLRIAVGMVPP